MHKYTPSSHRSRVLVGQCCYHRYRGGRNLSEHFSHPAPIPRPRQQQQQSWVDEKVSRLSVPGLASSSTVTAAARISRDGEEYILFHGVKVPKKPSPPTADGTPTLPPIIIFWIIKLLFSTECW